MNRIALVAAIILGIQFCPLTALRAGDTNPATETKPQAPTLTVAILDFEASTPANPDLGKEIGEALTAVLSGEDGFRLVDRASMAKTLSENQLNLTGLVNPDEATKIGKLTGAKILVTGRVFPLDKQLFFTAKIIGTETSRVEGVLVKGEQDASVGDLLIKLSEKVAARLKESGPKLVAQDDAMKDPLPALKQALAGRQLPKIGVHIAERHVTQQVAARIDPAAETEVMMILRDAGFTVVTGDDKDFAAAGVRYVVEGEAFSEFGAQIANLVNCIARVEIKVIDRQTNQVIFSGRETSRAIDLAENIAGKTALQKSGRTLAIQILQTFVQTIPKAADATTDAGGKAR